MRLLHSADWHFEADDIDECAVMAQEIVNVAIAHRPDVHVIAGDYWNRRQTVTSTSALRVARETMMSLAEVCPVVIIKGNNEHDQLGSLEVFKSLNTRYPIHVSEGAGTVALYSTDDESIFSSVDASRSAVGAFAIFHTFSYPTKGTFLENIDGLSIDETNAKMRDVCRTIFAGMNAVIGSEVRCPKVFIGHANMVGAIMSNGQTLFGQDFVLSTEDTELCGADYYAYGHIHRAQSIGGKLNHRYSGSTRHMNAGEPEKKSVALVTFAHSKFEDVSEIELTATRPISNHDATFIIENDRIEDCTDKKFSNDWSGANLRVTVSMTEAESNALSEEHLSEMVTSAYPGAARYKIRRIKQAIRRARSDSAKIVTAARLRDKFEVWANATNRQYDPAVLEICDEIESEFKQKGAK